MDALVHWSTIAIEATGIVIIAAGAAFSLLVFLKQLLKQGESEACYHSFRSRLGRSILLGLEFLVAADIIATVAIEPTIRSVIVLAGIVLIRTFLSFALQIEIEGKLPWTQSPARKGSH